MNKTVKLLNGHEMEEKTYTDRINFLWNQLEADGMEVYMVSRSHDCDIEVVLNRYKPSSNFNKALGMGRYKLDIQPIDDLRTILKINLC